MVGLLELRVQHGLQPLEHLYTLSSFLLLLQTFQDIAAEKAVLVVFPGLEAGLCAALRVFLESGLAVRHLVWDKGYKGGTTGPRLNYSTEDIILCYTQPVGPF